MPNGINTNSNLDLGQFKQILNQNTNRSKVRFILNELQNKPGITVSHLQANSKIKIYLIQPVLVKTLTKETVCNCFIFCCTLLYVHSSFAIIFIGRES